MTTAAAATNENAAAAGGAPEGQQTQQQSDVNVPAWVPADLRTHKSLTKFKEPGDVAKAYINLETMLGKRVEIPADDAPPEAKAAWRTKIGVPDTADGYDKPVVPEGVVLNEDIFGAARGKFHELGISKAQGKALTEWFVGMELDLSQRAGSERAAQKEAGMEALNKQWGAAAPRQIALCQRFVAEVGGADLKAALDETGAGNDPRVVAALAKAGQMMEESNMIAPVNVGMSTEEAIAEIAKIRAERGKDRKHPLNDKSNPGHKEAAKKFQDLHRIAYPDMQDL